MARQEIALGLVNSATATRVQLNGTPTAPGARATLVFDKETGHAALLTDGLPLTSPDRAYEVWFIPKGQSPIPGKVFPVDAFGQAIIMIHLPAAAMTDAAFAVSIEPSTGSASPTGAIYLASAGL